MPIERELVSVSPCHSDTPACQARISSPTIWVMMPCLIDQVVAGHARVRAAQQVARRRRTRHAGIVQQQHVEVAAVAARLDIGRQHEIMRQPRADHAALSRMICS